MPLYYVEVVSSSTLFPRLPIAQPLVLPLLGATFPISTYEKAHYEERGPYYLSLRIANDVAKLSCGFPCELPDGSVVYVVAFMSGLGCEHACPDALLSAQLSTYLNLRGTGSVSTVPTPQFSMSHSLLQW
jgi:hypothetical protein